MYIYAEDEQTELPDIPCSWTIPKVLMGCLCNSSATESCTSRLSVFFSTFWSRRRRSFRWDQSAQLADLGARTTRETSQSRPRRQECSSHVRCQTKVTFKF